jgi:hypothetical protein
LSLTGYFLHIKTEIELYKMDDAAFSIRHYVAALLPTNSGFFDESMNAKLAGATIVASN